MAGVVKKGYLDIKKKKGKIGSNYKRKYILLRRNATEGTKVVEIRENESVDNGDVEFLPLTGVWTVQDKDSQNKKRFPFELVIGAHIVMTFSCSSSTEREEWTESFRILNSISSYLSPYNAPDLYSVSLEPSSSAIEIGVSGPCLLRIEDGSIVLYSECGRNKLHHWASDNIKNLTTTGEQLNLEAYKPGSDILMEFCFNTEADTGRLILTNWNMALMQSVDPQRLSLISSYILTHGNGSGKGKEEKGTKAASLSRTFFGSLKQSKIYGTKDDKVVRRTQSFSEKSNYNIRTSPEPPIAGSCLSVSSQESYTINARNPGSDEEHRNSPPPIPPRAPRRPRSLGMDTVDTHIDPDYSYIKDEVTSEDTLTTKETKVDQFASSQVDQELNDLLRDIEEDNLRKKRRQTMEPSIIRRISPYSEISAKSKTLNSMTRGKTFEKKKQEFFDIYGENRQASDYLEPVPSKKALELEKRASNPPIMNGLGEHDEMLHQTKRHSTSGDFPSMRSSVLIGQTSHHDYSTIPDTVQPKPQHHHTVSTDSTQSAPELPPRIIRRPSQTGLDDPPSPPRRSGYPPTSPNKFTSRHFSLNASVKSDDISPYATRNFLLDPKGSVSPPREASPPPLPPRSPNKRERTSLPVTQYVNRCPRCNGMKSKNSLIKTCSLGDHHHTHVYPHGDRASLSDSYQSSQSESALFSQTSSTSSHSSIASDPQSSLTRSDTSSPPPYLQLEEDSTFNGGNKKELESALQILDDCVRDLEDLEIDLPETKRKSDIHTDLDVALQQAQQVQNDLLLAKTKKTMSDNAPVQRTASTSAGVNSGKRSMSVYQSPPHTNTAPAIPPRSRASLTTQMSNPMLQTESPPHSHAPLHRHNSQVNTSNTVFIHHIKEINN